MVKNKLIIILALGLIPFFANAQEGYPTPPETSKRLFYIQRNHNKNTIIYDARFDENGNLDLKKPIHAYWIRYEEEGQKLDLRRLEKWLVYGVDCEKTNKRGYDYKVSLSASKKVSMYLRQTAPFKAEVDIELKDEIFKLDHIYAELSETGWLIEPKYAVVFGYNLVDGKPVYQKLNPKEIK